MKIRERERVCSITRDLLSQVNHLLEVINKSSSEINLITQVTQITHLITSCGPFQLARETPSIVHKIQKFCFCEKKRTKNYVPLGGEAATLQLCTANLLGGGAANIWKSAQRQFVHPIGNRPNPRPGGHARGVHGQPGLPATGVLNGAHLKPADNVPHL